MCGRFVLASSPAVIADIFRVLNVPELLPPATTSPRRRQFPW
jgi:hypothetical protein